MGSTTHTKSSYQKGKVRSLKSDEVVGRTGVDLLVAYRWVIIASIIILGAAIFIKVTDFKLDLSVIRPYLSIVMAPISGYFIGYLILTQLFETQYVVVKEIVLDPRSCRTFLIPVKLFSEFNKSGNSVEYQDGFGRPLYFCDHFDRENREIRYSWPFVEESGIRAIADLSYFQEIIEDYNVVQRENLRLRKHAASLLLQQTRISQKELMDEIYSVIENDSESEDAFKDSNLEGSQ